MMWFTLFLSTLPRTAHGCAGLFASFFPSLAPSAPSYPAPYTPPYVPPPAPPPFIPPPSFPAPLPPGPPIPPPPLPPPIFPQGPIVGGSQFGGNGPMPPLPGFSPMGLPAQGQFPGLQPPPQFSIPQGNFQQGLQGGIMQLGQVPQPLPLPFNSGGQGSSFSNQNNQGDGGGGGGGNGNGNGNQGGGGGGFGSQIANQGGGGGGGGPIQPPEPQFMDWCYDNSGGQPPTGNPNCFVNSRGFQCCNREMDSFLEDLASTTTNQVRWRGCNIQRMVTDINKHSQERFNLQFETFVGSDNVCGRHNVLGDWMCKTRLADGKVIMVYAHPVSNGFNLDSYGKTQLLRNGTNYVLPH